MSLNIPAGVRERRRWPRSSAERRTTAVRWAAAIVFVVFGAGKFVNHASELASFRTYALPAPDVFVYFIGVLEITGGLLLAAGLLVRLAAVALAGDMVGAIVVSGLVQGEFISLTLAPALLVAMLVLIRVAAPGRSRDQHSHAWRHSGR
jgi:uncharacterized membrane protein YphA (DoxX/SURF4 family)